MPKIVGLAAAGLALATGAIFWVLPKESTYYVAKVYDGDTFETKEKQKIRLAGIDAPELNVCGGKESKKALEKLILNQPLVIKVLYKDPFYRLVSFVYTKKAFINEQMLLSGNAYYYNREKGTEILKSAGEEGRKSKLGIFSSTCTQAENPKNPKCNIKGNNRTGTSKSLNYYFLPTCRQYNSVIVQLYLGDQWFCTESEAKKAGYTLTSDCN